MNKENLSPLGTSWENFEKTVFTPEEIAESNIRVSIMNEVIHEHQEQNIAFKKKGETN